jgi:hypothetical protein
VAKAEFASGVAVLNEQVYWADWMRGQILRHNVKTGREDQGLVTVPFWEYWTSPYSSHYRPYIPNIAIKYHHYCPHDRPYT